MRLEVDLPGARAYPIHVAAGGLEGLGAALAEALPPGRAALVSNPVVAALYREAAEASLREAGFEPVYVEVPDGEAHKTLATWQRLVEDLLAARIDRRTPVLALGGGVTGDMVGFAAAAALRGVPFVQVPTTLLAMVDSAVGGKTGVNSARGKNLVGAFYQPRLVYAAVGALQTLDLAEIRCGLGEVLKHAVIRDEALFQLCLDQADAVLARDPQVLQRLVARCCAIKAAVVAADEREEGLRAILNFGHTVGHAIEKALGYGELRHGECVGIGMLAEARWAAARGDCAAAVPGRIAGALSRLGMLTAPPPLARAGLLAAAGADKKLSRGTLATAILERIGYARLDEVPAAEIAAMLDHLPEA